MGPESLYVVRGHDQRPDLMQSGFLRERQDPVVQESGLLSRA